MDIKCELSDKNRCIFKKNKDIQKKVTSPKKVILSKVTSPKKVTLSKKNSTKVNHTTSPPKKSRKPKKSEYIIGERVIAKPSIIDLGLSEYYIGRHGTILGYFNEDGDKHYMCQIMMDDGTVWYGCDKKHFDKEEKKNVCVEVMPDAENIGIPKYIIGKVGKVRMKKSIMVDFPDLKKGRKKWLIPLQYLKTLFRKKRAKTL